MFICWDAPFFPVVRGRQDHAAEGVPNLHAAHRGRGRHCAGPRPSAPGLQLPPLGQRVHCVRLENPGATLAPKPGGWRGGGRYSPFPLITPAGGRWRGGGAGESRWALQGRLESDYWGPQCVTGSRCAPSLQLSKCTESNKSPSMLCSQGVEGTPPWRYALYPYTPLPRWACRDKSRAGGICRPESHPEARRRP